MKYEIQFALQVPAISDFARITPLPINVHAITGIQARTVTRLSTFAQARHVKTAQVVTRHIRARTLAHVPRATRASIVKML